MANLNKKIRNLMNNRPKYQIGGEYGTNQGIASNKAYGRSRAIMGAEENIEQNMADNIYAAQEAGGSGSDIVSALASMSASGNREYSNLAIDEAQIQDQGMNDLMTANIMMAEEKDKEWNYNVNMPYQQKLAHLQQKKANKNKFWGDVIGGVVGIGSAALTGGVLGKK